VSDVETDLTERAESAGRRLPRALGAVVGAVFVVAAVAFSVLEPTDIQTNAPFATSITALGQKVTTRAFNLTVTDVRFADRLTASDWVGSTDGVWLVIEIVYAARIRSTNVQGVLHVGGVDYDSSARADDMNLATAYSEPGLPWSRTMIFELPVSALAAAGSDHAVVEFGQSSDVRLDGVIELPLDLSTVERVSTISISEPGQVSG
jgi:hypothetical protein